MLKAYAGVARVPFLLLPVTLVAVGAAAAAYQGSFSLVRTLVALVGLIGMHVAVNVLNEVSDFKTGIDFKTQRTPFSGGSGTLPAGQLSAGAATGLALIGAAVGLAAGIWLVTLVGWKLLPIMAVGAIASLAYSSLLARCFLGEFFAGLGLGTFPVLGSALVQSGEIGSAAIWASLSPFFMTFNLLLLNEFPDEQADREGGRRNLVLLLGRRWAALLYVLWALLVPATIAIAVYLGIFPLIALLTLFPSLLLIAPIRWAFRSPQEPTPIPALGANVAWNLATNVVLAACLGISAWLAG